MEEWETRMKPDYTRFYHQAESFVWNLLKFGQCHYQSYASVRGISSMTRLDGKKTEGRETSEQILVLVYT